MPELPDVTVYVERIAERFGAQTLQTLRLGSPFVLRSVSPPPSEFVGKPLVGVSRLGKRIVLEFPGELFAVVHLMIAGRFHLKPPGYVLPKRHALCAFDFPTDTLLLTEVSTQKRASLHLVAGREQLAAHERGGLEPMSITQSAFKARLSSENRTLKRALTDPRFLSGIGNAYSDEILHRARLSPVKRTQSLEAEEWKALHKAMKQTLSEWVTRLRAEPGFPEHVTAFRPEMAVHGKFGKPCPDCDTKVQRIRYASNEVNYCPRCQTEGRLLADRSLSRLLKEDWPKTIEELEELRR